MAIRRSLLVPLAGLLILLVIVPAVASAAGHAQGNGDAGSPSAGSGRGTGHGAGDGDSGTGETRAGVSSPAVAAVPGADTAPPDATTSGREGIARSRQARDPVSVTSQGSAIGSGIADRAGAALGERAMAAGSSRQPGPEVSHSPGRQSAAQSETAAPRAVRTGRSSSSSSGTGHGGGEGTGGARGGEHHRGMQGATNPVPFAAPVRTGHEQNGPEPGTSGASAGRSRKDTPLYPVPVTGDSEAPDPVLLLRFLVVLGFRRVRPGNVLEHPARRALHSAIRAEPGLDLAGCAAATGTNRETLRYHLALLVCCGKVVEETRSGSVRYFPHDPAMTPVRRAAIHALLNESLAPILAGIRDAPGISRRELAERLGVAGPSVTRQVQRLYGDGLVEVERCGRTTCYRLTASCGAVLGPPPGADSVGMAVEPASA